MTISPTAPASRRVLCTKNVTVPQPEATLAVRPSVLSTHPPVLLGRPTTATPDGSPNVGAGSDMVAKPVRGERDIAALARVIVGHVATTGGWTDEDDVGSRYLPLALTYAKPFSAHVAYDRLVKVAAGFASTYTYTWWPDRWSWAGSELDEVLTTMSPLEQMGQRHVGQRSPRLAWRSPQGQLLLDEVTPVDLAELLLDDWMRPRVAADLAAGLHIAGRSFAGVRIVSPRLRRTGLLVTPDGQVHDLRTSPLGNLGRDL